MATRLNDVIHHLGSVALAREGEGLPDAELLERFLARRDEAAFAALVRRHGPMVLGVCRRLLRHRQDAEDAFQATFLVLVRKAATIARRELLGNWLYGVAYRTASKARSAAYRRRACERQVDEMTRTGPTPADSDVLAVLDEELNRLPEKYRLPLLLCDLQGRPRGEAAQRLDCPLGTLSSRLARGREMLRQRLVRRGLSLTPAALAVVLTESASASVPASLLMGTIRAGMSCATGLGVLSGPVAALTEGVLKSMLLTKRKIATLFVLALAIAGAGTGLFLYADPTAQPPVAPREEKAKAKSEAPPAPERTATDTVVNTYLLRNVSVQRGLQLNDKQLRKIQKIREDVRAKHKAEPAGAEEVPPVGSRREQQAQAKIVAEEHEALMKVLPDMLKEDQLTRLRQISLQRRGVRAFELPEVAGALRLTAEQRKQVAAIVKEANEQIHKRFAPRPGGHLAAPVEIDVLDKITATAVKKVVVDVLTEEQEQIWKEMLGKPFAFQREPLRAKIDDKKK